MMKTYSPRPRDIERRWYVIDADGVVLGRLASQVASILRGKHKPIFAPHMDTGDHVIVINAGGVVLTGQKAAKKIAYRHSGYPGGLTATTYTTLLADRPTVAVERAVRGMLPKNSLGRKMITKLQVYEGAQHPHQAQQPQPLRIGEVPGWSGLGSATVQLAAVPASTAKPAARAKAKVAEVKVTAKRPAKPKAAPRTAKPKAAPKVRAPRPAAAKKATTAKAAPKAATAAAPKKAATAKAAPKKAATAKAAPKKAATAKPSTAKRSTTKKK